MTSLFALRTLFVAGELLAGSTIVMALGWMFACRKNAGGRHLVWASGFGAALALPLFAAILPSPLRILVPAASAILPARIHDAAALTVALSANRGSGFSYDPATVAFLVAVLWFAGILAVALRFAAGAFCLSALRRRSRPFACAPEDLPKIAASRRECELRLSDAEYGPVTWGVLRPVVLLPRTAVFWPRQRLHAVLLHELAHIRRRDSLVQVLSLLVCALYWPNPLVWLGARALRREAEMAADDCVILAGLKPSSYANELLHLAAEFRSRQPAFFAVSLFMAAPSALESRVESVLEPTALRTGVTKKDIARMAAAALALAGAIAFACPSLAQDASPARSRPPVASAAPAFPAAPPAPAVPPALPVPPAPEPLPVPEASPVPAGPAAPAEPAAPGVNARLGANDIYRVKQRERKCLRAAIERAEHAARVAAARETDIAKVVKQVHAREMAMRAVREMRPQIDAAVAMAQRESRLAIAARDVQPAIDRALAEAQSELAQSRIDIKIGERVKEAISRAQRKLEAAPPHGPHGDESSDPADDN